MRLAEKALMFFPRKVRSETHKYPEDELRELAVEYVKGNVSYSAVCRVLNSEGSSVYGKLLTALARAVYDGEVKITYIPKP